MISITLLAVFVCLVATGRLIFVQQDNTKIKNLLKSKDDKIKLLSEAILESKVENVEEKIEVLVSSFPERPYVKDEGCRQCGNTNPTTKLDFATSCVKVI